MLFSSDPHRDPSRGWMYFSKLRKRKQTDDTSVVIINASPLLSFAAQNVARLEMGLLSTQIHFYTL